jgi:hypothetical protein
MVCPRLRPPSTCPNRQTRDHQQPIPHEFSLRLIVPD